MKNAHFTTTFSVDESPEAVFAAINDVRRWWSEEIDGRTDVFGAEFAFRHKDLHRSKQTITELVPGKKVVWQIRESQLTFVEDEAEWDGTQVVFEIARTGAKTEVRFTHIGLVPAVECYGRCTRAWSFYVNDSLRRLITTGSGQPERKEPPRQSATG